MTVYRCFVEKKPAFAVEAASVKQDLLTTLKNDHVSSVRVINRYDIENISLEDYRSCLHTILSEPQVDDLYEEEMPHASADEWVLAVEYLPGQYDQRADSCAQCIQLSCMHERPDVRSARIYYIKGTLSEEDKELVKSALINPVESRQALLEKPDTIIQTYPKPSLPKVLEGFGTMDEAERSLVRKEYGLAMDEADLAFLQEYFRDVEKRDPTMTELRVIDTYWSDHCRHTTFNTILENIEIEPEYIQKTYNDYLELRKKVHGSKEKPVSLWDIATIGAKALKQAGKLKDLDESEEINACSVKITVDVDGKDEDWLLMFKNETHNHPTEIEPFGGAATCLGGAIRDPLSGRSYVYQAMRVSGGWNPLAPIEETMQGKLPQRKIVTGAAAGYSSYGNQIGLATGHVHEIYHPGYVAKRMEVGAVLGAAPVENVVRERPIPGDVVILLGGKTGRDGCGGATGSSKSHTVQSLETCGAEVQKGNAPEERKLQRLFRNPKASRLIKRCNDFGAGGVSVAIGELAPGLHINLDKVPRKYEGLDGTELAISESQERMAVVTSRQDAELFCALADEENLDSTIVAEVSEEPRLVMELEGKVIVDIARSFLDTNGAKRYANAYIATPQQTPSNDERSFGERMEELVGDLNVCSQKGLVERFDSTIGAGTILMPFGGKWQLTPSQAMACKLPVLNGETNTCSLMAWGYDPYASSISPYKGAQEAVIDSIAKIIAAGGRQDNCWLSFQEFFGHVGKDPKRWGLPMAALLGALKAQMNLGVGAIGGKDSMSGTFEDLDVPPTLISFAVSTAKSDHIVSTEFKGAGHYVYLLQPKDNPDDIDYTSVNATLKEAQGIVKADALAAWVVEKNVAEGLFKMMLGNHIGVQLCDNIDPLSLFDKTAGSFIFEVNDEANMPTGAILLGKTIDDYVLATKDETLDMVKLQKTWEDKLQPVYPYLSESNESIASVSCECDEHMHASYTCEKPHVLIPVFPGTNCEWDTARAFARQGADPEIIVIRNRTSQEIEESAEKIAEAIKRSQIIALPGGFSGGDEPDGSGKFITAFFRNPKVKEAVTELLDEREGLMLGICNGFQALIKLGLVPYGKIIDTDETCPTLTFNTIGRHQSMLVRTRVASNKSPWLRYCKVGEQHTVAISHGEGRFVASEKMLKELVENGQIATQYVDLDNQPTTNIRFNPNNSLQAIEGITSKDGRILGKMGHSERSGKDLYRNIPDQHPEEILFKGAIDYFR